MINFFTRKFFWTQNFLQKYFYGSKNIAPIFFLAKNFTFKLKKNWRQKYCAKKCVHNFLNNKKMYTLFREIFLASKFCFKNLLHQNWHNIWRRKNIFAKIFGIQICTRFLLSINIFMIIIKIES